MHNLGSFVLYHANCSQWACCLRLSHLIKVTYISIKSFSLYSNIHKSHKKYTRGRYMPPARSLNQFNIWKFYFHHSRALLTWIFIFLYVLWFSEYFFVSSPFEKHIHAHISFTNWNKFFVYFFQFGQRLRFDNN